VTASDIESLLARARDDARRDIDSARDTSDATTAAMLAMMAQQRQQPAGIDRNTLLIGGAVVGVGLLAVLLLK
jgi:hypothetical protein